MIGGYRQTELGLIPVDWNVVKLFEVGDIISGGTPDTKNKDFWDGEISWCTPTDITALKGYKYISKTDRTISELGLKKSSATLLPELSLIVCTRATLGDCAINKIPLSTNQGFKSIIPNRNWDVSFLYYIINSIKDKIKKLANGSTFLEISKKIFEDIDIQAPPLPEQQKIAEIFSTVDHKIIIIEEQIQETQQLKKGVMQTLLTKGIGHTKFKASPFGDIPESWEVKELNQLINPIRPIRYGIVQTGENVNDGIPCLRVVDFSASRFNKSLMVRTSQMISNSYKQTILEENDIVFPLRGCIGEVRLISKEIVGVNLTRGIALISHSERINASYLLWMIRSSRVKKEIQLQINGTTLKEVPIGGLKQILIPVAPFKEQQKIASILSSIDEKIDLLQEKKVEYTHLKKGLMQQLLTGKIRVNQTKKIYEPTELRSLQPIN